jgi:RNA polymerase sigma factor (sigma-70 family)
MVPNEVIERQYQQYRKSRASRDLAPVLEALAPKLLAAATRAGLDETGAEDAMQETFLGFIMAEEQLDGERPIVPYVNGIADRQIKAEIRRRARRQQVHQSVELEPQAEELPETQALERAELKAKLQRAVSGLSQANGSVVSAALFEGLNVEEISKKLDISHSAAAVSLHRGLSRVRESLGSRAALGLLAFTVPRHQKVLPGILPSAGVSLFGMGLGVLVPAALLLVAGIWGLVSLLAKTELPEVEAAPPSVAIASVDATEPVDSSGSVGARAALPPTGLETAPLLATDSASAPEVIVRGSITVAQNAISPGGAEVFVLATTPSIVLPTKPMVPVTTCDAKGRFELASDVFEGDPTPTVLVRAPGYVGYVDVTEGHQESGELPEVTLRREMLITIDARDKDGSPLEGIELSAVASSPRFIAPSGPTAMKFGFFFIDPYHHLYGAVTDENGRGVIHGIPGYGARGFVTFLSLKAPGFGREALNFRLDEATGIEETIVMKRTHEMSLGGLVHDAENQPIVGAEVRFLARGETPVTDEVIARSDESGAWSIPHELLDDFPIFLEVVRDEYCSARYSYAGPGEVDGQPVDVMLRRSAPLDGRVVDGQGRGVPGAEIEVTTQHTSQTYVSDERGEFKATGLTADPRTLRASGVVGEGSPRSLSIEVDADTTTVEVVLERDSEAGELVIVQAEGVEWERVELIPLDAGSEVRSYAPTKVDGDRATFERVRTGRWLAVGITKDAVSCVEPVEFVGPQPVSTHEVSKNHHASLKLWLDQKSNHPVAAEGKTGVLHAKCVSVDWLPDWLERTEVTPRSLFRSEFHPESERVIPRLVPGEWDLFGFAPGWAIGPMRIQLDAGSEAVPELDYTPAGLVTFNVGHFHRGTQLVVEVRRSEKEPWITLAHLVQGTHDSFAHELWLPEGPWSWRASVVAKTKSGERFQLIPSETGKVEVARDAPTAVSLWK